MIIYLTRGHSPMLIPLHFSTTPMEIGEAYAKLDALDSGKTTRLMDIMSPVKKLKNYLCSILRRSELPPCLSRVGLSEPWRDENRDEILCLELKNGSQQYMLLLPADDEYLDDVCNVISRLWTPERHIAARVSFFAFGPNVVACTAAVLRFWNFAF